ncbi:tetratricopeptide repeat protein [Halodesulfovibrio aestuarii]|uniref:Tetratricopeptide repeat protein n=1 Tax=Halodesulfovibrio aestuarii TaxID=126333 RepID=A0A8G2CD07_9BACT|nr:tetratricopeptide repeat protein [Halodesulfovibrio aestuarii]SHJ70577.1 Tetratricopeptide repeat-containing protein [Halodesulfovibrio aestuarii]
MSAELTRARTQLSNVRTYLKQAKIQMAAQALHDGIIAYLKYPLMKAEKQEFLRLLEDSTMYLAAAPKLKEVFPIALIFKEGEERQLVQTLKELLVELQKNVTDEAQQMLEALERQKQLELEKGQMLLDTAQHENAVTVFNALLTRFSEDADLKSDVAERYIRAGMYSEAFTLLAEAIELSPENIRYYNSIGMALRKMGKYDVAEKYFAKAVKVAGQDPHLFFNLGRVYVDWEKWDKCAKSALMALKLDPEFKEAEKMLAFAKKRMA